jgi:hypothetical protein
MNYRISLIYEVSHKKWPTFMANMDYGSFHMLALNASVHVIPPVASHSWANT